MPQTTSPVNLGDYLTVKEAARFLGVCPGTLRNWDRSGKLRPARHPINGYRLYRREQLDEIIRLAAVSPETPDPGRRVMPPQHRE